MQIPSSFPNQNPVGPTHRKHEMHDHVEGDKRHQNVVEPLGQLSLGQFHGKEDGHNCK